MNERRLGSCSIAASVSRRKSKRADWPFAAQSTSPAGPRPVRKINPVVAATMPHNQGRTPWPDLARLGPATHAFITDIVAAARRGCPAQGRASGFWAQNSAASFQKDQPFPWTALRLAEDEATAPTGSVRGAAAQGGP